MHECPTTNARVEQITSQTLTLLRTLREFYATSHAAAAQIDMKCMSEYEREGAGQARRRSQNAVRSPATNYSRAHERA